MKNQFIFSLLVVGMLGCKSQLPEQSTNTIKDATRGEGVMFKGEVFGQQISGNEAGGWTHQSYMNAPVAQCYYEDKSQCIINTEIGIKDSNIGKTKYLIQVFLPSFSHTEYPQVPLFEARIRPQKYAFEPKNMIPANYHNIYRYTGASVRVSYWPDPDKREQGIGGTSFYGDQDSRSSFEIVAVKRIPTPEVPLANARLYEITFKITCKLYDKEGKYIGDLKDATIRTYYPYDSHEF
jgi:hypothetical protein